jgi:hypothetical protein
VITRAYKMREEKRLLGLMGQVIDFDISSKKQWIVINMC